MRDWKGYAFYALIVLVVVSVFVLNRHKAKPKALPTPEQVAKNECAATVISDHLKVALALSEQQVAAATGGVDSSSVLLMERREKEAYCLRFVECFKPPEILRGPMLSDCLKEEL